MINSVKDEDFAKTTGPRSGFLETFVVVLIGTFALLASTLVRSMRSLWVTLAISVVVATMAGSAAAFFRGQERRRAGG